MLFVAVLFVSLCAVSHQQTPPALAKQFTTNWTLAAINWVGPSTYISPFKACSETEGIE